MEVVQYGISCASAQKQIMVIGFSTLASLVVRFHTSVEARILLVYGKNIANLLLTADLTSHGVVSNTKQGISMQTYVCSMGKPTRLAHSFRTGAKGTHHALLRDHRPNDPPSKTHKGPQLQSNLCHVPQLRCDFDSLPFYLAMSQRCTPHSN